MMKFEGSTLACILGAAKLANELKLQKVLGTDYEEIWYLHQHLNDSAYFNPVGVELITSPVSDIDGNSIYAQFATR